MGNGLVTIDRLELQKLSEHAIHHGNCSYHSWNKKLTQCGCGLFQLLTKLQKQGLIQKERHNDIA